MSQSLILPAYMFTENKYLMLFQQNVKFEQFYLKSSALLQANKSQKNGESCYHSISKSLQKSRKVRKQTSVFMLYILTGVSLLAMSVIFSSLYGKMQNFSPLHGRPAKKYGIFPPKCQHQIQELSIRRNNGNSITMGLNMTVTI